MPPNLLKGIAIKQEDLVTPYLFSLEYNPYQYLFYIGNKRLPYQQRIFYQSRPAKIIDYVKDSYLRLFALDVKIPCNYLVCKKRHVTLNGVLHFKSYTQIVYKIKYQILKTNSIQPLYLYQEQVYLYQEVQQGQEKKDGV